MVRTCQWTKYILECTYTVRAVITQVIASDEEGDHLPVILEIYPLTRTSTIFWLKH